MSNHHVQNSQSLTQNKLLASWVMISYPQSSFIYLFDFVIDMQPSSLYFHFVAISLPQRLIHMTFENVTFRNNCAEA